MNTVQRFLFKHSDIRGEIVKLDTTFAEACEAQSLDHSLRPLFGEFVAGVCLITEMLKFDGTISLHARGEGPVSIVMSEASQRGEFRGLIKAELDDVINTDSKTLKPLSELIDQGVLALTLDPTKGKRYQGIVPLTNKDLAESLAHYFEQSEQIPTHFILFADGERCGGLLLQCLPSQEITDTEERESLWQTALHLASTVKIDEFFDTDNERLLYRVFHELACEAFTPKPLTFKCSCSKARSENALRSLGHAELESIVSEGEALTMNCHLCGQDFEFSVQELNAIMQSVKQLH